MHQIKMLLQEDPCGFGPSSTIAGCSLGSWGTQLENQGFKVLSLEHHCTIAHMAPRR